jgi:hypothetical protein
MGASNNGERRIELYVRSLAPGGTHSQQDTVVRRLDDLLDAGAIADYDVRVWGDRIRRASAVARTVDGQHVQDRLARMEQWADRAGYSLDGIYREVDHECTITDESWTEVRFPQIALAEFVDDELVHLAPAYEDGDGDLVEVADRLADLDASTDGGGDDEDRRVEAGGVEH